jgi:acyl-CoA reductase-like NAD-dependent aldehyde dehydrogenase
MNGQYVNSESDKRSKVSYPYNGKVLPSVPLGTTEDIDRAVTTAQNALESEEWGGFLPSERANLLHDIADAIDDHADDFAEMEARQNTNALVA